MSKALTFKEFAEIVNYISEKRSMLNNEIGYPTSNTLTLCSTCALTVFSITFRGLGEKQFHCVNECSGLTDSMYERIMQWLNTKKGN